MLGSSPPIDCPLGSFYVSISGVLPQQHPTVPIGYFPHGDPHLQGEGVFTFHKESMDWSIQLSPSSSNYTVTQAHIYNLDRVTNGDSWACWGGRWTDHDYLEGTNFRDLYGITADNIRNEPWVLILHTEGGHFAIDDATGQLVVYDAKLHESSVTGTKEKGKRFNNRVPRKLTNRLLREANPVSGKRGEADFDALYADPDQYFQRTQDEPFMDAHGNTWIVWNGTRYVPSAYGQSQNLTLDAIDTVEYLFYRYDDQGPEWDWGGPEGAGGGVLIPCAERPTQVPMSTEAPIHSPTVAPIVASPTDSPMVAPVVAFPTDSLTVAPVVASPTESPIASLADLPTDGAVSSTMDPLSGNTAPRSNPDEKVGSNLETSGTRATALCLHVSILFVVSITAMMAMEM